MNRAARLEFPEPERYELSEPAPYKFELNRREFVQTLGAGLLISVALPDLFAQRRGRPNEASVQDRLHIGTDGTITVFTKVEVGQGSRTELTMAAAEELSFRSIAFAWSWRIPLLARTTAELPAVEPPLMPCLPSGDAAQRRNECS